jgi:hypothetical protein
MELMTSPFAAWESFYVIVGSSAGALTGLQFVVIALISDSGRRASSAQIGAFGTPTIVHFCTVLVLSAVMSAPWPSLVPAAWLLGLAGWAGIIYVAMISYRAREQQGYKPVFEDWLFHVIVPFVSYALLFAAGIILRRYTTSALFMLATSSVLLLLDGIHNSWDTVTFIVLGGVDKPEQPKAPVEN